jgi:uncharacterized protein YdeI (YjbR/CyaY-like superfamily)
VSDATFFATSEKFRAWLAKHHDSAPELWVGFWKVGTGKPSITWPQAVDQALCYGWIDGVRRSLGDESYRIRFTPRRAGSTWSNVNVARVAELTKAGLMTPAGLAAYERRMPEKTGRYAYEREHATFDAAQEKAFRANAAAWAFWQAQPPWYRRNATFWVVSAKRQETRDRRFATLVEDSAAGLRLARLTSPSRTGSRARPR